MTQSAFNLDSGAAEHAKRKAAAPLKPSAIQEPCDIGLFSDDAKQMDLINLARKQEHTS